MHQQSARRAPSAATVPRSIQVVTILQVSPTTITRRAKDGRLPHQRTFGDHRHPTTAIRELAASLTQEMRAA
jgi:phospholipase/lecithinase/hemolysin